VGGLGVVEDLSLLLDLEVLAHVSLRLLKVRGMHTDHGQKDSGSAITKKPRGVARERKIPWGAHGQLKKMRTKTKSTAEHACMQLQAADLANNGVFGNRLPGLNHGLDIVGGGLAVDVRERVLLGPVPGGLLCCLFSKSGVYNNTKLDPVVHPQELQNARAIS
jgi:hypothetical protein